MNRDMWRWFLAQMSDDERREWLRKHPDADAVVASETAGERVYDVCANGAHLQLHTDLNGNLVEDRP